jgi:hypothetical protein
MSPLPEFFKVLLFQLVHQLLSSLLLFELLSAFVFELDDLHVKIDVAMICHRER